MGPDGWKKCTRSSLAILFSILVFSCSKDVDTSLVNEGSENCQKTKLENEFIIHWKDGKKSLVHEKNIQKFIEKNKSHLKMIEPNYLLQPTSAQETRINPYSTSTDAPFQSAHDIIHTENAWSQGIWGQGITVAVIDTGIELNHPLLHPQLAINEIESRPGPNQIDDDENGFVDDIYGWNFVGESPEQKDEIGHGTAMAGIITGMQGPSPSLSLAPQAKILSIDFMDQDGGTEFHAHEAMAYALSRKVHIINNSWSISCSELLKNDFVNWGAENVIFVNASGNTPVNVSQKGIIPSSLSLPNNLNVGSLDEQGHISTFSGYGETVKIFAPGEQIPTLFPESGYNLSSPASGTSVSTAIVSGAAALIWSAFPNAKATDIISLIEDGAYTDSSFHRILDIRKSIRLGKKRFRQAP